MAACLVSALVVALESGCCLGVLAPHCLPGDESRATGAAELGVSGASEGVWVMARVHGQENLPWMYAHRRNDDVK